MTIDERLEALTMSVELLLHEGRSQSERIDKHSAQLEIDAENIRTLARIAEIHNHRLERLEDTNPLA